MRICAVKINIITIKTVKRCGDSSGTAVQLLSILKIDKRETSSKIEKRKFRNFGNARKSVLT